MGLDISKITNAELQRLAFLCDTDGNKSVLSEEEFEIFKQKAAEKEGISAEDFNQAMGLYTTNPAASTEATATAEVSKAQESNYKAPAMTDKQAKKWGKGEEKNLVRQLKNYVQEGAGVADTVEDISDITSNPKLQAAVSDVAKLMPEYTSVKDVDKKHNEILKRMKQAGINDDLHKDILKQLEAMAKNECKNKAYAEIGLAYAQKKANYESKGEKKTSEDIMDEIKAEAKKSKKFKDEYEDAFKEISKGPRMLEAYQNVYKAIGTVNDKTKWKKVRKEAKQYLKDNNQWDEYTKKALMGNRSLFNRVGNWIIGYKTDGKIASQNKARWNNVEKHRIQTTEKVMKALGKKTDLLVALKEAGYVKQTEDGNWDLTELSKIIGNQLGANAKKDRHASIDKLGSEKLKSKSAIAAITRLADLSDSEAKDLIQLCGYKIEHKNIGKALFGGLLGLASGAAGGAAAEATTNRKIGVGGDTVHHSLNLELNGISANDINIPAAPDGTTLDIVSTTFGCTINIEQLIQYPNLVKELSKRVGEIALKSALVGAAIGLASGLKDTGEIVVLSNNFEETKIDAYCDRIKKENPKYSTVAVLLAESFVKNGEWNREEYRNFLNTMGGNGGKINREELIGGLQKRLEQLEKQKETENVNNNDNNNSNVNNNEEDGNGNVTVTATACSVNVDKKQGDETVLTENKTHIHKRKGGDSWGGLVKAYYPELVKQMGESKAIKALQRELCTDENGNFDKAKFTQLIRANDLPKEIKMPLKVNGVDRVIGEVTPIKITRPTGAGRGTRPMDKIGRDEFVSTKQVGPSTYIAQDGCDNTTASGSSAKEAVETLEKTTGKKYTNRDEYVK